VGTIESPPAKKTSGKVQQGPRSKGKEETTMTQPKKVSILAITQHIILYATTYNFIKLSIFRKNQASSLKHQKKES
jgi:hypothetical protein